ncbi:hypothetical protein IDJ77_23470 [Mucilaginibacter sp. ZT4R22]|uniref:3-keto-disaccharide hydrolase domain-containing protein n=1 Tax=Mucilaginibacter pankratovii TaxID=2772110 RepID=A0ABR7WWW7_9SPHI|nr:hypothetical protein [Mucilaginibacter pankratovii]MBD1366791.1 hypothetical protein [Mucilaginibacter pankratovii]
MKKNLLFIAGLWVAILSAHGGYAQAVKRARTRPITFTTREASIKKVLYPLAEMLKAGELEVVNREATAFEAADKKGIKLSARENDGVAWLKNVDFTNGVIELDIKGKDVLQHSFVGIAFHGTGSPNTMDVVYFRPFNFRAPDSVRRIHAVQYVSLPQFDWEILREKYNGQYEKDIRLPPMADGWFHVKIVVKSPHVLVFVDGHSNPSLAVKRLNSTTHGKIGLWVGNTSDGEFANLTVDFTE